MPKPFLGVRIPNDLNEAIASRMRETGQSRSDIAIAALRCYLGLTPCYKRLDSIEERLVALETRLGVRHQIVPESHAHHHSHH
ncbi:MAG: hypothetical protein HC910_14135 [Spirulinaceae cyanobacterium SM2_1_0]|nr:hypothetical protein [Spirulinaceae cyanobacterium SM2_1_0]